ncbi:hypothetical protein ACWKT3_35095 [Streptomyces violaceus]
MERRGVAVVQEGGVAVRVVAVPAVEGGVALPVVTVVAVPVVAVPVVAGMSDPPVDPPVGAAGAVPVARAGRGYGRLCGRRLCGGWC